MTLLDLSFEHYPVRIAGTPDRPEWVARDVCRLLGLANTGEAIRSLPPLQRGSVVLTTPGGEQPLSTVTEAGLYRLIFKSRKPIAERLETWLCDEVLPSLRKYGCYPAPQNAGRQSIAVAAQMLETLQHQQQQLEEHDGRLSAVEAEQGRIFHPDGQRWSVRGYSSKFGFDFSLRQASLLGKKCSRYCREHDIDIDRIDDPRFGEVNLYPEHVLNRFAEEV